MWLLKICVRRNDRSLEDQDGLNQRGHAARTFQVSYIGFDGTNVERIIERPVISKCFTYPGGLNRVPDRCTLPTVASVFWHT